MPVSNIGYLARHERILPVELWESDLERAREALAEAKAKVEAAETADSLADAGLSRRQRSEKALKIQTQREKGETANRDPKGLAYLEDDVKSCYWSVQAIKAIRSVVRALTCCCLPD